MSWWAFEVPGVLVGGFIALFSSLTTLWLSLRSSGRIRRRESVLRAQRQTALSVSRFIRLADDMVIPVQQEPDLRTHRDQYGNEIYDYRSSIWSGIKTEWDSIRTDVYVVTTVEIRDADFVAGQGQQLRTKLDALSGSMAIALTRLHECCNVAAEEADWLRLERQKRVVRKQIDELTRSIAVAEAR